MGPCPEKPQTNLTGMPSFGPIGHAARPFRKHRVGPAGGAMWGDARISDFGHSHQGTPRNDKIRPCTTHSREHKTAWIKIRSELVIAQGLHLVRYVDDRVVRVKLGFDLMVILSASSRVASEDLRFSH